MLRITEFNDPSETQSSLLVEGSLIGPWVKELYGAIVRAECPMPSIRLDLQKVHFVDSRGLALLQWLKGQHVTLEPISPFIRELLLRKNHELRSLTDESLADLPTDPTARDTQ